MDEQAPIEALLAEYRKIVGAVRDASITLNGACPDSKETLKSATHLMMAMLPSNHCCEIFPDDDEETIDGEGWKKGRTIEEDDE